MSHDITTTDGTIDRSTSLTVHEHTTDDFVPATNTDGVTAADIYRCPYCNRPFRTIRLKSLHVGESHPDDATTEELEVFEKAVELEEDDLFFFHIKVVIALGVIYATSAIGYTVVIGLLG